MKNSIGFILMLASFYLYGSGLISTFWFICLLPIWLPQLIGIVILGVGLLAIVFSLIGVGTIQSFESISRGKKETFAEKLQRKMQERKDKK